MKVNKGQAPLNGCCTLLTPGVPPLLKATPRGMSDNDKGPDALLALMVMCCAGRVFVPGYAGIVFIPDSH